jgi:DNA-binding MltR family transcriptional regulator
MAKKSPSKLIKALNLEKSADLVGLLKELQEGSDRATAILAGVYLDEQLSQVLKGFLIEDKNIEDALFGPDRPLGTFSSRIKMAYALGLLNGDVYHDLETIRDIRNVFAHALHGLSFEYEDITRWCKQFIIPRQAIPSFKESAPIRTVFIVATLLIASYLTRKQYIDPEKRRGVLNDHDALRYKTGSDDDADDWTEIWEEDEIPRVPDRPDDAPPAPSDALGVITAAAAGLLVPSESDYPLESFRWPGPGPLTPTSLLAHLDLPPDTPVETRSLDAFFGPLVVAHDSFDEGQRAAASRFASLRDLIAATLADLVVYRVGRIQITVIIAGADSDRNTVGLRTTLIET